MPTRNLGEDRELLKNMRLEVVELAGIEFRKSPQLTSFPNRNRVLHTG